MTVPRLARLLVCGWVLWASHISGPNSVLNIVPSTRFTIREAFETKAECVAELEKSVTELARLYGFFETRAGNETFSLWRFAEDENSSDMERRDFVCLPTSTNSRQAYDVPVPLP